MDDSALYTGVDGETDGVFGNEVQDDKVKQVVQDQKRLLKELTPQLQDIIDMIEGERQLALDFISKYVDATKDEDSLFRAELKAAGRYRTYLETLKTKFELALNETKGK